jgi:uncharacterized integral membrane protein
VGRIILWLLLLAAFCVGAALSYYNWSPVAFDYLAGEVQLPLIALLLTSFMLGGLTVLLLNTVRIWSLRLEMRRTQKRLRNAETELKNLRNLPLAPGEPSATTTASLPAISPPPKNA